MICGARHSALAAVLVLAACTTPLPAKIESPRVSIANIDVVGLTVLEQHFAVSLRIQNPNAFSLPVRGMSVSLSISGREVGQGVSAASFELPALSEVVRDIEITSDLSRLSHALRPGPRSSPSPDFRLRGQLALTGRTEPLAFEYGGAVIGD